MFNFFKQKVNKTSATMFEDSLWLNQYTFNLYYERLTQLALSRIRWHGLPESIDRRFIENVLFYNGAAVAFDEPGVGMAVLQVVLEGLTNVYGVPMRRRAYASNFFSRGLTNRDSVVIYNNLTHTNSEPTVRLFAYRLAMLDRVIDVNTSAQKTPVMVLCDENQRLTMLNMYKKYSGNEPFIFGTKALDAETFKVLKTDAPYHSDKIYELKVNYWNECMTYLGISNASIQKRERVTTDEVNRSMGGALAARSSYVDSRNEACQMINRKFGTDWWVEWNPDVEDIEKENMEEVIVEVEEQEGGGEDGTVYGGTEERV